MPSFKIKKGDHVIVLSGRDKGKHGEVIEVRPKENRALVRGVNMVRRHQKQTASQEAGIISKEGADPSFQPRHRGSEGRQADARRLQVARRRQEGPLREALGRESFPEKS